MQNKKLVAISGAFDPIHVGHVRLIQDARKLGDRLVVILNNDNWLREKKKHVFMHEKERKEILESIDGVDKVVLSFHKKNSSDVSVSKELIKLKPDIFAKGGNSRREDDIPEAEVCRKIGCKILFNVGHGGKIQSSSGILARYVEKLKPPRNLNVDRILSELRLVFAGSPFRFPEKLRIKTSKVLIQLMNRKRGFGLFIILGWQNKWDKYIDMPDARQDVYVKHHQNLLEHYRSHQYDIEKTINFDGAILVDKNGNIIHSGVMIEGLKPKEIANKIHPGKFNDLSEQFGFKEKVHLRHLSAISASYIFQGTTVFTVSEESDSLHLFEGGKIIYSIT